MTTGYDRNPVEQGIAADMTFAAAILLLTASPLALLHGISALADDDIFVAGPQYIYRFDLTTWGWIAMVLGGLAFGMFTGAVWARIAAIVIAALSIVATSCGSRTTRDGRCSSSLSMSSSSVPSRHGEPTDSYLERNPP